MQFSRMALGAHSTARLLERFSTAARAAAECLHTHTHTHMHSVRKRFLNLTPFSLNGGWVKVIRPKCAIIITEVGVLAHAKPGRPRHMFTMMLTMEPPLSLIQQS